MVEVVEVDDEDSVAEGFRLEGSDVVEGLEFGAEGGVGGEGEQREEEGADNDSFQRVQPDNDSDTEVFSVVFVFCRSEASETGNYPTLHCSLHLPLLPRTPPLHPTSPSLSPLHYHRHYRITASLPPLQCCRVALPPSGATTTSLCATAASAASTSHIIWCCSWTAWCGPCLWWSRWPKTRSSPLPSPQPSRMKLRRDCPAPLRMPRTIAYRERIVAIKVLHCGSTLQERVSRENRFACEVNMMSSVHHENLVKFIGACKDPLMAIVIEMLPEWQCLHVLWALERLSLHGYSSHRKFPCIWIWCSFTSKTKKIVVLFQTGDVNLDWYVSKHDKGHEAIQAAFHLDEKVKAKGCSVEEERNAKSDDDICEDDVAVEEAGGSGIERVVIEIDDDVVVVDDEGDDYNVPFVIPFCTIMLVIQPVALFATAIFMYFEKRSYGVVKKILFSPLYGLFMPFVHDDHWWCYLVKLSTLQIFVIDSLGKGIKDRKRIDKAIVENLEGFFGIMYNRPEWRIGPLVVEQANISSQPNLHNCGVIMLKAMEMWDGKEKYNG
ncbi:hypothetical protein LR48_Vigan07g208900 [Vigna angularis]|uniref:Serine-threonine/tyrosine-protein kinase catalytic domain-containing protein n=1 Tax=Phaseolus angularis TaxID=3914 RepID=A0A0L9UZU5_PHAAN|nr:hypothetical protein LR48_Vigan07g208900 [Vigna angularis]